MAHHAWLSWLQVSPARKGGALDVWALVDTFLHRMTVHVPRALYVDVDFSHSDALAGARPVDRTLPDGTQAATLLELEMSEADFVTNAPVCILSFFSLLPCLLRDAQCSTSNAGAGHRADNGGACRARLLRVAHASDAHRTAAPRLLGAGRRSRPACAPSRWLGPLVAGLPRGGNTVVPLRRGRVWPRPLTLRWRRRRAAASRGARAGADARTLCRAPAGAAEGERDSAAARGSRGAAAVHHRPRRSVARCCAGAHRGGAARPAGSRPVLCFCAPSASPRTLL